MSPPRNSLVVFGNQTHVGSSARSQFGPVDPKPDPSEGTGVRQERAHPNGEQTAPTCARCDRPTTTAPLPSGRRFCIACTTTILGFMRRAAESDCPATMFDGSDMPSTKPRKHRP
jgi:hypothetical protein